MLKNLFVILFAAVFYSANAQDTTLYDSGYKEQGKLNKGGSKEGKWKQYYTSGQIRMVGKYRNGIQKGKFKKYNENGGLIEITHWLDDGMGLRKSYHPNGKVSSVGLMDRSRRSGLWKTYYSNGQLECVGNINSNSALNDEDLIGEWKCYYENGQLREVGEYRCFQKVGKWKQFNEKGILRTADYGDPHCDPEGRLMKLKSTEQKEE